MRIAIVGPGALGSFFAARLALADGHDLCLLDHEPRRAALLTEQGLFFEENGTSRRVMVRATADPAAIAHADLLLLCVKSHAVRETLTRLRDHWPPGALLLAFQNGIAHLDPLAALPPSCCWGVGVTTEGATLLAPGQVRHGGHGLTRLGFVAPQPEEAHRQLVSAAAAFSGAGLASEVVADIRAVLWQKLLVNVGINALTALHDCPNGRLLEIPAARVQMIAAVEEAAAVARAEGVAIPVEPVAATLAVCRATAGNISSMLQDLRRRRPTEIAAINGAVVAIAERLGIATPINRELTREIRALEQGVTRDFP